MRFRGRRVAKIVHLCLMGLLVGPNLTFGNSADAAEQDDALVKLRKLARFPSVNIEVSIGWKTGGPDRKPGIWTPAKLRKALAVLLASEARRQDEPKYWLQNAAVFKDLEREDEATASNKKALKVAEEESLPSASAADEMILWSDILAANGRSGESEAVLRQAAKMHPDNWEVWVKLGQRLDARAWDIIKPVLGMTAKSGETDSEIERRKAAEIDHYFAVAHGLFKEAQKCFDRGVELGSGVPDAYFQRASQIQGFKVLNESLDKLSMPRFDYHGLLGNEVDAVAKSDILKWCDMETNSVISYLVGFSWIFTDVSLKNYNRPAGTPASPLPDMLSEKDRAWLESAQNRLKATAERSNGADAAICFAILSQMDLMFWYGDSEKVSYRTAARTEMAKAIEQDPNEPKYREALIGLFTDDENEFTAAVPIAEAYARDLPSARSFFILGKIHFRLDRYADSAKQIARGLELEPTDMHLLLARVALAIRRNDEDSLFDSRRDLLLVKNRLREEWRGQGDQEISDTLKNAAVAYFKLNAIVEGLWGTKPHARAAIDWVLKRLPNDDNAKEILDVIKLLPDKSQKEKAGLNLK